MSLPAEKGKPLRIAILGIYHESNTFVQQLTTIDDFKAGRWLKGDAILKEYANAYHELGGAIEIFSNNAVELIPVFYAETAPGGAITADAFQELVQVMFEALEKVLPVDGCLVVPHGAAVAVNHPDMDGDWLQLLRDKLGMNVPIVGTLDPHANVSECMVAVTQGLFPYRTNPHIDQRDAGRRAALFLLSILRGEIQPVQQLLHAPMAISIEKQNTNADPCKDFYDFSRALCDETGNLSIEIVLGFPYADVYEMGTSIIIISHDHSAKIEPVVEKLHHYLLQHLEQFCGEQEAVDVSLSKIKDLEKPVLLLDMGDNVGGGTTGDSTFLMDKLDASYKMLICIFAPDAVSVCRSHQNGQQFRLSFGNNPATGKTYVTQATLTSLHEGKFEEHKPRHGGQVHFDMGSSAVIQTASGSTVLLHSKRMPPFSLSQLTSCNINPSTFDVIIAKGVNAPIAAYAEVCPTRLQVYTPGASEADMTRLKYHYRRKPLYPFEDLRVC